MPRMVLLARVMPSATASSKLFFEVEVISAISATEISFPLGSTVTHGRGRHRDLPPSYAGRVSVS